MALNAIEIDQLDTHAILEIIEERADVY